MRAGGTRVALALACVAALIGGSSPSAWAKPDASRNEKPNIVLLMTDDQTVSDMQVMSRTRKLLAGHGTSFKRFYSSYPLCCPARATMLTGQYAHNHGVLGNLPPHGGYQALQGTDNTLPVWLQRAGYYTGHIGKYLNGYGRDAPPDVPPGWSEWYGAVDPSAYLMWGYTLNENGALRTYGTSKDEDPALYQTDVYRDKAIDFIRRRAPRRKPFYLSVGFLAPHSEALREFLTVAEGPTVRPAPRHAGAFANEPLPPDPSFDEADVSDKPSFYGAAFPPMGDSEKSVALNYYRSRLASLLAVDEAVQAIVSELKKSGEFQRTLIVFTSDNGFITGQHRFPFGKYLVYEPSVRVPTILRGPGVKRGRTSRELSVNTDLAATIVDAAGAKPGRALDGRSLLPFARDPRRRTDRPVLLETGLPLLGEVDPTDLGSPFPGAPDIPRYQGIRMGRYVYVEYAGGERELYDLKRDPYQLNSLDGDPAYARTEAALAHKLDRIRACKGRACRAETKLPPDPKARASARAHRCPAVPTAPYPDTAGARAAQSGSPLFRRVDVPGFTDQRINTAGVAVEDFNHDSRADLFAIYNDGSMRMLLGRGCMRFEQHRFEIVNSPYGYDNPPGGAGIANWADINGDGNLDAFITRNRDGSNVTQQGRTSAAGNTLLLSQRSFDRFREAGPQLGLANETAYNRGSSIADVDGDGRLDIAVGSDQIGTPQFGGEPVQRLYVWRTMSKRFVDIGGTDRLPDFGGPLRCDPAIDKASPGILLRDLGGDRRPELVQGYHDDMLAAKQEPGACVTGERRFGLFAWRNRSKPGKPRYVLVPHERAGLGGVGQMRYDYARRDYDVVSHGLGLPYVFAADAFNTGRLDLIAVGPTDPEWHVNSDMIAGAFFRNRGGLRFANETDRRGLGALNWTLGDWAGFYGAPINGAAGLLELACLGSNRKPTCSNLPLSEHQIYPSTIAWGDFDNDGCLDFVLADRHEDPRNVDGLRNTLFRNRCDGTFAPTTTQFSGLDTNSISVEVADVNGDGLLDLVEGEQPTNSYPLADPPLTEDRFYDKVYLNTGAHGVAANHWVEVDLSGRPQRRLLGAQLTLTAFRQGKRRFLGRRDYVTTDSYKSGRWPRVHWGLGKLKRARIQVLLPDGRHLRATLRCVDRRVVIDVKRRKVHGCGR